MNCTRCDTAMTVARENFLYTASGLPYVTLVGVEVRRCPNCGEYEVLIPRIEDLHRTIARVVARKRGRLAPAEIRFLRKWLGWSGVDFAAHVGVAPETVSRWENGNAQMGPQAERLLRLMVATRDPVEEYSLELLKAVDEEDAAPFRLGVRADDRGWHPVAA